MNTRKSLFQPAAAGLFFLMPLFAAVSLLAQGGGMRETLGGMDKAYVSVEGVPPSLEGQGINPKQIRIETERKLREAGIRILEEDAWRQTADRPCLSIQIKTYKNPGPAPAAVELYAYSVEVRFFQAVSLLRDPGIKCIAPTWSSPSAMGIVQEKDAKIIQEYVTNLVAGFVNDYLLVKKAWQEPGPGKAVLKPGPGETKKEGNPR